MEWASYWTRCTVTRLQLVLLLLLGLTGYFFRRHSRFSGLFFLISTLIRPDLPKKNRWACPAGHPVDGISTEATLTHCCWFESGMIVCFIVCRTWPCDCSNTRTSSTPTTNPSTRWRSLKTLNKTNESEWIGSLWWFLLEVVIWPGCWIVLRALCCFGSCQVILPTLSHVLLRS